MNPSPKALVELGLTSAALGGRCNGHGVAYDYDQKCWALLVINYLLTQCFLVLRQDLAKPNNCDWRVANC